jgi:hypothetical protein
VRECAVLILVIDRDSHESLDLSLQTNDDLELCMVAVKARRLYECAYSGDCYVQLEIKSALEIV